MHVSIVLRHTLQLIEEEEEVKRSIITALANKQVEGRRREASKIGGERMEGSAVSPHRGVEGLRRGRRLNGRRRGCREKSGGGEGGGGVLIQPSQWVYVTCLHTQQCASPRSQRRDSCTMSRLLGSLSLQKNHLLSLSLSELYQHV